MKNGDVRGACLALIRHRVGASLDNPPKPTALGLRLEQDEVSVAELANLCAALVGDLAASAPSAGCWLASETLQALLGEYRRVQRRAALAAARPRPRNSGYATASVAP
ncbi:MAG: hypothetical protein ABI629_26060 [bacterium]